MNNTSIAGEGSSSLGKIETANQDVARKSLTFIVKALQTAEPDEQDPPRLGG